MIPGQPIDVVFRVHAPMEFRYEDGTFDFRCRVVTDQPWIDFGEITLLGLKSYEDLMLRIGPEGDYA